MDHERCYVSLQPEEYETFKDLAASMEEIAQNISDINEYIRRMGVLFQRMFLHIILRDIEVAPSPEAMKKLEQQCTELFGELEKWPFDKGAFQG